MLLDVGKLGLTAPNFLRAEKYAPYAAPTGWRWDFVIENNERVTQDNEPVVELVRSL